MKKYRSHKIIIIFACVVLILFIVGATVFTYSKPSTVEKYDTVKIDYIVWESDTFRSHDTLNPLLDSILWVTMVPITENDTTGLMLGLYNNLLGKRVYYESDLIWLDKCIDENRDGIDDITNATALTYGNSTDQYYNTCLMIKFQVLDIEKGPTGTQELFLGSDEFFQAAFYFFQISFFIILPIFLISIPIVMALIIDYLYRHPIDSKRVGRGLFKYGLMIGFVGVIQIITIGVINLTLTPEELDLIISRYNLFIPFIVFSIMISCISFTVIYLLLYKIMEKKKNRKKQTLI